MLRSTIKIGIGHGRGALDRLFFDYLGSFPKNEEKVQNEKIKTDIMIDFVPRLLIFLSRKQVDNIKCARLIFDTKNQ